VHHVARRRRGAAHVVAALDERDVDALQGEVTEGGDSVDAAADDEHICLRAVFEGLDVRAVRRR